MEASLPRPITSQDSDCKQHTVVDFLQRPQIIKEGTVSGATSFNQFIDQVLVPSGMMFDMIKQKLSGFTSFTATAVIRLQLQTQPFMAGRLIMGYVPTPTLLGERGQYALQHVETLQLMNHVQMDLSKDTEATLRIPFVSPYVCYDLISSRWDWAKVVIRWYSPLNTVGSIPLDYVIYGHFEDIQLGSPTSGILGAYVNGAPSDEPIVQSLVDEVPSGSEVARVQTEERASSSLLAPVIKLLKPGVDAISKVKNTITDTVNDASSKFDKIKTDLGFSKPQVLTAPLDVNVRAVSGFALVHGVDNSHVLSLTETNASNPVVGVTGTKVDEMSFDYLKKIPQYLNHFEYNNSSKGEIFRCAVYPGHIANRVIGAKATANASHSISGLEQPSHLKYITSVCKYWSGSLIYRFMFVKTNYHSGRVAITFHPFVTPVGVNKNRGDYVYRVIVDLREKSEISVSIPFVSASPWKRINDAVDAKTSTFHEYPNSITGILMVEALTSLKAQSSIVSTKIDCLVEISAGNDFRTCAPLVSSWAPFTIVDANTTDAFAVFEKPYAHQHNPWFITDKVSDETQEDDSLQNDNQQNNNQQNNNDNLLNIGGGLSLGLMDEPIVQSLIEHSAAAQTNPREQAIKQQPISISNCPYSIRNPDLSIKINGEKFLSFRQLIKRNGWIVKANITKEYQGTILGKDFENSPYKLFAGGLTVSQILRPPMPYWLLINLKGTTSYSFQVVAMHASVIPLTFVSSMYGFFMGGIRVKAVTASPNSFIRGGYIAKNSTIYNPYGLSREDVSYMAPLGYEQSVVKRVSEFAVPYYGLSMMASHWIDKEDFYRSKPENVVTLATNPPDDIHFAASAADDLNFLCFIGTPPCVRLSLASQKLEDGTDLSVNGIYPRDTFELRDPSAYGNFYEDINNAYYKNLTTEHFSFSTAHLTY
uniref:Structural polyprotein n=1 Tax=Crocidura shantungensis ribovirus 1 TaxID=3139529 RepID=A0AB38ZK42_9VIRU